MSVLLGVAVHRALPEGHALGATVQHEGETLYITREELDRVKSMPSPAQVRHMLDSFQAVMDGATRRIAEQ